MADIVLKDRNGSPVEYPGVERIKVNTVDGEAVEFVDSAAIPEVVENLPIALDFSGGNQTIIAPDGVVVKSAIIQQPANLIPENIAEGVDIAGIIGMLAAGGGGVKVASGLFTGSGEPATIEHGLGVTPDLILVSAVGMSLLGNFTTTSRILNAFCASESAGKIFTNMDWFGGELPSYGYVIVCAKTSSSATNATMSIIDLARPSTTTTSGAIFNANDISFTIGEAGSARLPANGVTYSWLAIGGLT